jgi:predicted Rdx family selenoprotein
MIEITYCRLCGWGLRAGWMAQELLVTFAEDLGGDALVSWFNKSELLKSAFMRRNQSFLATAPRK